MTRDSSDSSRQRAADDTRATSPEALEIMLASAARATDWGDAPPAFRATALRTLADAVDARGDELAALARVETNLGLDRLRAEVRRTSFQLRFMAEVLDEGSYLEAVIDTADASWPPGPRPDLRRVLHPIGPVLVFAGSNFPFAFSTVGGGHRICARGRMPRAGQSSPGPPAFVGRCRGRSVECTGTPGCSRRGLQRRIRR